MKHLTLIALIAVCTLIACQKKERDVVPQSVSGSSSGVQTGNNPITAALARYSGSDYSQPILKDTANRMIQSYLTSINYPSNDTTLRSLSFDADTLRAYLNDASHAKIVTLKFMLAHKQSYINAGHYGQNAGTRADAITLVMVGLDEDDKYVYERTCQVYDHFGNCPDRCTNSAATLTQ